MPLCLKCKNNHKQNERLKDHVERDFNEMLLAKTLAELTPEEKQSMEESALYHENRVSKLLGQHDIELMKT